MLSMHINAIDVLDNIYEWFCPVDFSYRCFFLFMNFSDRFRQGFKLFYSFEKQLLMVFFQNILKKTSVMETRFITAE